jgi:hypothetical protein
MGRSEQLIGEATHDDLARFVVDTKVFTDTATDGSGDLTEAAIQKSIDASLERLQRPSVSTWERDRYGMEPSDNVTLDKHLRERQVWHKAIR